MPVIHIKESISKVVTTDSEGYVWITKRIQLPEGHRYDMLSVDIFNDNGLLPFKTGENLLDTPAAYQLYVSPYPMGWMAEGEWGYGVTSGTLRNKGQPASEKTVLYKEIGLTQEVDLGPPTFNMDNMHISRFPNDCVGSVKTQEWFSPHVYVTLMIWNTPEVEVRVDFSVYLRVNKKKTGAVSSSMGRYAEFLDSQIKRRLDLGEFYDRLDIPGYFYPTWRYGGIRPEIMLSGAQALRYYNKVASNESQEMLPQGTFLANFKEATTMVEFDAAFGDAATNLPDWITIMDVAGVTAGPIRQYAPPLKYADNGNTLMF